MHPHKGAYVNPASLVQLSSSNLKSENVNTNPFSERPIELVLSIGPTIVGNIQIQYFAVAATHQTHDSDTYHTRRPSWQPTATMVRTKQARRPPSSATHTMVRSGSGICDLNIDLIAFVQAMPNASPGQLTLDLSQIDRDRVTPELVSSVIDLQSTYRHCLGYLYVPIGVPIDIDTVRMAEHLKNKHLCNQMSRVCLDELKDAQGVVDLRDLPDLTTEGLRELGQLIKAKPIAVFLADATRVNITHKEVCQTWPGVRDLHGLGFESFTEIWKQWMKFKSFKEGKGSVSLNDHIHHEAWEGYVHDVEELVQVCNAHALFSVVHCGRI